MLPYEPMATSMRGHILHLRISSRRPGKVIATMEIGVGCPMLAVLLIRPSMDLLRQVYQEIVREGIVRRHVVIVYAADDVPLYEYQGLCLMSKGYVRHVHDDPFVAHADVGNHDRVGWTILRLQVGVVLWMHFRELIEDGGRVLHRVEHQCRDLHHIMHAARGAMVERNVRSAKGLWIIGGMNGLDIPWGPIGTHVPLVENDVGCRPGHQSTSPETNGRGAISSRATMMTAATTTSGNHFFPIGLGLLLSNPSSIVFPFVQSLIHIIL